MVFARKGNLSNLELDVQLDHWNQHLGCWGVMHESCCTHHERGRIEECYEFLEE